MAAAFDPGERTIPELQAALAAAPASSRGLVEHYLARIDAYDQRGPALNAICARAAGALAVADRCDAERCAGAPCGPLHGIPVIVKDNYETADMQTAAGSVLLAGWIPPGDATLVTRLRAAGAIVIAKATMHEFAYGVTTAGSLFGQTRNPYALDRNPGGSSGGTGAAIAAGFAAIGMGSDTCGSIRIPAAHNSLVGIRGTQGLASRAGIVPMSSTQDIGGPIGRSVVDVAIVLDAIAGYDPADPQTAQSDGNVPQSYTAFLQPEGLRGARLAILADLMGGDPEDAEVNAVIHAAAAEMRGLGATVEEIAIPDLRDLLNDRMGGLLVLVQDFKADLNAYLASRPTAPLRSLAEALASGKVHPAAAPLMRTSEAVATRETGEYWEHVAKRERVRLAVLQAMAEARLDAFVYPTMRRKAALIGETQVGINCRLSAVTGLPSLTVPAGFTPDGLPVGVELLGRSWSEGVLLKLGYAYEQATRHRRPPASTPPLTTA
ncbi:MAG TPA: amidase family protein [Stellaceae bacterium]|nr:amidase family protein [Stellaceae bacterium]